MGLKTYAVDTETYYDNDLSVTVQGAVNYALQTQIYMVSIYGPGVEYVGPVESAPWWEIDGEHWVSHNAGFDMAVYHAACLKGQVPTHSGHCPRAAGWDCTADLVAYLGVPRSLADAVKELYSRTLDKAMRGTAKGKHWPDDFKLEDQERMLQYALRDSKECWQIWEDYSDQWPEHERELSRITRERALQGVKVDRDQLHIDLLRLDNVKRGALKQIPWYDSGVILSHKKVKEYCSDYGIPAPISLAEDSEECAQWEETYGEQHKIVGAIRDYRKANRTEGIVTGMINRIMPNGRMNFGLKYFGAHTGRWSGVDGINMQNPNKEPVFGVDVRARMIADEGKQFGICDLAQIEPRCSAWLVGDMPMMEAMRAGYGIYEAAAVSMGIWIGDPGTFKKESKAKKDNLYDLLKAQVLALGYGAGPAKFVLMAKWYCDLEIELEKAERIVASYRKNNYRIVNHWERLEQGMKLACRKNEPFVVKLPSGRYLTYTDIELTSRYKDPETDEWKTAKYPTLYARCGRAKKKTTFWGGKLFENLVQATARDVLAYAILNLEKAGIPVLWSAHDEVITEVPKGFDCSIIKQIMKQTPPWLEGLVLDADLTPSTYYRK